MGFLTSTVLSGVLYDAFKKGSTISSDFLKEKLQGWLINDELLGELTKKINTLNLQDYGEHVIERKLNESNELQEMLKSIKTEKNINIDSVTQNHSGTGDNIVGNKIIYHK